MQFKAAVERGGDQRQLDSDLEASATLGQAIGAMSVYSERRLPCRAILSKVELQKLRVAALLLDKLCDQAEDGGGCWLEAGGAAGRL